MCVQQWYYPYPDYKFPVEIFTEASVNTMAPSASAADHPYDLPRAALFDAGSVYQSLMKDQLAGYFSNSFLVELGCTSDGDADAISYVKISNNRKRDFGIATIMYGDLKRVDKKPLYPEAVQHLKAMEIAPSADNGLRTISSQFVDEALVCEFVPEETLQCRLERFAQANAVSEVWTELDFLKSALYQGEARVCAPCAEFRAVFGSSECAEAFHWTGNVNIDLTAENIFCREDGWLVIDNEWVFPFPIPAEYALWRALTQQQENPHLSAVLTADVICDFLGVTPGAISVFRKWEAHFSSVYVGIRDLSELWKPVYPIDLDEVIAQKQAQSAVTSQLFLFFEDETFQVVTCQIEMAEDGIHRCATFSSQEIPKAKSIRWDPLEGIACRISEIVADGFSVAPINAEAGEPEYTFATFDPQMQLLGDWSQSERIQIRFCCQGLDWTAGYLKREQERDAALARGAEAAAAQHQCQAQNQELRLALEQLRAQQSDMTQQMLQREQKITALQEKHIDLQERHTDLQQRQSALQDQHTELQARLGQLTDTLASLNARLDETSDKLREMECAYQTTSTELQRILQEIRTHKVKSAAKIILRKDI